MTAPDLVEVVAGVLASAPDKNTGIQYEPDDYLTQARAVLDALAKVGEVEWGVENGHTPIDHVTDAPDQTFAALRCRARQGRGVPARVVSRLVLPWTAVE